MAGDLKGSYQEVSKHNLFNLDAITRMWHQDDGVFKRKDELCIASCDNTYRVKKSPEEISTLFNKLASGADFIQIGNKCVRAKSIQSARYDGKRLRYHTTGIEHKVKMPQDDAEEILTKLERQDRFEYIKDSLVNMNKVVHMQYPEGFFSSGCLNVLLMGGKKLDLFMSKSEAKAIMDKALEKTQFGRVCDDVANIAVAGSVHMLRKKVEIEYPFTSCKVKIGTNKEAAMEPFSKEKGFVPLDEDKYNPSMISRAWRRAGWGLRAPLFHFNIRSGQNDIYAEPEKSNIALGEFARHKDYVGIGKRLVNIRSIGFAAYDGKELKYSQGADLNSKEMSEREARTIMEKISSNERMMDINGIAVNIPFATGFRFDEGDVECLVGGRKFTFEATEGEAQQLFEKISEFDLARASELSEVSSGGVDREVDDYAWDPDLIEEVHRMIRASEDDEGEGMALLALGAAVTLNND